MRWGVVAPGTIADDFVSTLHANTDQRTTVVASRSPERAAAFAAKHGIPTVRLSYEALVSDPSVDIVYVAAPHSEHQILRGAGCFVSTPGARSSDAPRRSRAACE
ncbi:MULTISPECIES: Gfo/Idh/MocA family oxidoreductase [Microbacterium]|uniref:Gfo/Idh/MocA family oxidoreductase n=1 Tax=Microbacterium TaxID=33882 RepID=UPI000A77E7D6|nr:Gfo/Idh/MocA family oxidoreductase [Microbacterium sp. Root1433D1]